MVQAIPPQPTVADGVTAVVAAVDEQARRQHYGQFYELEERPDGAGFLLGNCQAESLRIVMHDNRAPLVRIPPVHELTADDMPFLERLIAAASVIIAQPISDDYHSLPLGTRQVFARAGAAARTVTVPIVRFTGLHPFQAVVRVPGVSEAPPIVDYHDVREVALAAGLPLPEKLGRDAVRAIADELDAAILITGKIVDVERRTEGGFVRGSVTVAGTGADRGRLQRIELQNENLLVLEDGEVIASVPDLITILDAETGHAISTEMLRFGQRVSVLAWACDPLWRTDRGLELAGPRAFGYDLPYVPFEGGER